jgi:hypothetical protein
VRFGASGEESVNSNVTKSDVVKGGAKASPFEIKVKGLPV